MTMYRDFVSNVRVHAGDDGDSIDLREFDSVIVVSTEALAGEIEVSDEADSGFAAASTDDLVARTGENGANVTGYFGDKRYLKVVGDDADQAVVIGYNLHRAPEGFSVDSEAQESD